MKDNKEDDATNIDTTNDNEDNAIEKALTPDDLRVVTKPNSVLAYEEIFQMWKVDLNLE